MLIVAGADKEILAALEAATAEGAWWYKLEVSEHVEHFTRMGLSARDAITQVATERGLPKNQVYNAYHK